MGDRGVGGGGGGNPPPGFPMARLPSSGVGVGLGGSNGNGGSNREHRWMERGDCEDPSQQRGRGGQQHWMERSDGQDLSQQQRGGGGSGHLWTGRGDDEDPSQQRGGARGGGGSGGGVGGLPGTAGRRHDSSAIAPVETDPSHAWTPLHHPNGSVGGNASCGVGSEGFGDGGLWDAIETNGLGCGAARSSWPSALLSPEGDGEPWIP